MSWTGYQKFEMDGSWLKPGFCIYLMEIAHGGNRYFYIGMTGDPNYPSARAAFHRLSGHLELTRHSTQNQLSKAFLEKKLRMEDCHITMHHFPMDGFKTWERTDTMRWSELSKHFDSSEYLEYKGHQQKVLRLEKALIHHYGQMLGDRLLNRTAGKQNEAILKEYAPMQEHLDTLLT